MSSSLYKTLATTKPFEKNGFINGLFGWRELVMGNGSL
jgi:hypothetical protein